MWLFASSVNLNGGSAIIVLTIILIAVILLLISPWLIALAVIRRQAVRLMEERTNTVVAQYDPPYGFSAAEVGLLYDMKCDMKEIYATLLSLQYRNVVTIDQVGSVTLNDSTVYEKLLPYEQIAIRMYDNQAQNLGGGPTMQTLAPVADGTWQPATLQLPPPKSRAEFTLAVRQSLDAKGYSTRSYWKAYFVRMFVIAFIVSFWPIAIIAMSGTTNNHSYSAWSSEAFGTAFAVSALFDLFLWPSYLIVGFIAMQLWVHIAGRSWLNTKQIRQLWPELEGYRLFLKTADLDVIQTEAEAPIQNKVITASLPYAVVFDLDTKWQQRLRRQ